MRWQDFVPGKDEEWTRRELELACSAFNEVFDSDPATHGAAGWQLNSHLLGLEQEKGFAYASDVRGRSPFFPSMGGIDFGCVQIPTTLPTLDELIGCDGNKPDNVHETVFRASREVLPHGHVYTLHAELEGMKLLPVMEQLLRDWRDAGDEMVATRSIFDSLDTIRLPRKQIVMGEVPGRSGLLALEEGVF